MGKVIEPSQWLSLIASFALVLVLLLGTLWVLRRIGAAGLRPQSGRRLAIVESLWVGNRQRIVLLRVDDTEVLVGISAQGITRLDAGASGTTEKLSSAIVASSLVSEADAGNSQSVAGSVQPPAPDARQRFVEAMRSIAGRPSSGDRR
ncbi:MAG: flagellar biosynthetic protein FliO [Betaproteobacteria bacterium]|nr:flagellar biosynthetic protein FliO [Betaproteobacteria bacterium]